MLEQRHADIVKDLTTQMANDREHWSNLNAKLDIRIKTLESEEAKLRLKITSLQQENSAFESDQINLQKQITDMQAENKKLNSQIVDLMEKHGNEESLKSAKQSQEVLDLVSKLDILRMENATLRDKNDELTSEIEEKTLEMNKLKLKKLRSDVIAEEGDSEALGLATKRRGDSPSKTKITEESPKLGKMRKYQNIDGDEIESENSGEWMSLNSELNQSISEGTGSGLNRCDGIVEEMKQMKCKLVDLEKLASEKDKELKELQIFGSADDIKMIKDRNVELESCLEQMRKEYEDCEDYWQGKLNEERQLYEDEQRITNEKFNDLLKKMTEYEDQFVLADEQNNRLSPIDEKYQLEEQYAELEAEANEIKSQVHKILEEKSNEIQMLQIEIGSLKQQLGKSYENDSPASSPISYLWQQSTIQAPIMRDYQNPKWGANSTTKSEHEQENEDEMLNNIAPIQRPITPTKEPSVLSNEINREEDAVSIKSQGNNSIASTNSR